MEQHPAPLNVVIQNDYRGVARAAWILLFLVCGAALTPVFGFGSWLIAGPILIAVFVMSIVVLSRGGTAQGIFLLLLSLIGAPIFIFCAPFVSSLIGVAMLVPRDEQKFVAHRPTFDASNDFDSSRSFDQPVQRNANRESVAAVTEIRKNGPALKIAALPDPEADDRIRQHLAEQRAAIRPVSSDGPVEFSFSIYPDHWSAPVPLPVGFNMSYSPTGKMAVMLDENLEKTFLIYSDSNFTLPDSNRTQFRSREERPIQVRITLKPIDYKRLRMLAEASQSIVGNWRDNAGNFCVYNADGTGTMTLDRSGKKFSQKWKIDGEILTITHYDVDGKSVTGHVRLRIREITTSRILTTYVDSNREWEAQKIISDAARLIVGAWRDENSLMIFKADGTGTIVFDTGNTQSFNWEVYGDTLIRTDHEANGVRLKDPRTFRSRFREISESRYVERDLDSAGKEWHAHRMPENIRDLVVGTWRGSSSRSVFYADGTGVFTPDSGDVLKYRWDVKGSVLSRTTIEKNGKPFREEAHRVTIWHISSERAVIRSSGRDDYELVKVN